MVNIAKFVVLLCEKLEIMLTRRAKAHSSSGSVV